MFPTLSQYNRVIQQLGSVAFSSLNNLFFIPAKTSPIKIYNFGSGSFAVVFKALENSKEIAIRCFIGSDNDYVERYRKIDNYLSNIDESWKTNIKFLDNEIKIEGKYYPVLKMDWVDGKLLNKYIDKNLENNYILSKLQKQFVKISNSLEENRIAHGDIQCGNIIIQEVNGKIKIKLIDYDGLYIPYFSGQEQKERGRSEFQHPNRSYFGFNEKIDRFSFWVIICALEALKFDKTLWKETMQGGFNTLDNMLFVGSDFSNPNNSKLFQRMSNLNQPSLNYYIAKLKLSLNTSNIEKLSFFGQENTLIDIDSSRNTTTTIHSASSIKENNQNQYARLKITSTPSGASVRNKDFEKIGITPISVNKYEYINQEIKIIFGTKSKSIIINEYSNDLNLSFEESINKSPIIDPIPPIFTPPLPPFMAPEDNNTSIAWIILTCVVILLTCFIATTLYPSGTDSDTKVYSIDTTAVNIDTTAIAIDTTATFVDNDTEPTVIIDSAAVIQTENIVSEESKEVINQKIKSFDGGYIVDNIEEYNYDLNNSKWILSENIESGELFLNNYNLSFKKSSLSHWQQVKLEYETFDRKSNCYVFNDNHGQKIIMDANFEYITFLSDLKNNQYLSAYIYHILRKS